MKVSAKYKQGLNELNELIEDVYRNDAQRIDNKAKDILREGLRCLVMGELSRKLDAVINNAETKIDDILDVKQSPYSEMRQLIKDIVEGR